MGAMAAAARLAVAGHRVAVYERGGDVRRSGAAASSATASSFDTGPGLLHLPAVYRDLFVKTGKEPLEECVELVQVDPSRAACLRRTARRSSLPNASRAGVVQALEAALGAGAGDRWGDFLVRAREAWDRTRRPLLEEPLWTDWQVLAEREPYPAVPHKRLLRTRRAGTLAEVAAWELRDPRLTALLDSHALAYGLDPRDVPASAAVLPYMEHAFGTWYVRGGIRELARAVYERCLARRVEFVFGAEVTRIVEKDGRAAGLELADGTVTEADHVVAGVDPVRLKGLTEHALDEDGDVFPGRVGAVAGPVHRAAGPARGPGGGCRASHGRARAGPRGRVGLAERGGERPGAAHRDRAAAGRSRAAARRGARVRGPDGGGTARQGDWAADGSREAIRGTAGRRGRGRGPRAA